jgi:Na+-driven multidrug efflux pump
LRTILYLSIGPTLAQFANAIFAILTTLWIGRAIGDDGLSAMSTMNAFDGIGRSFGFFLSVAASTQVSALYGEGKSDEAGQMVADLLRTALVCGVLVPAVMLPCLKPAARWFGSTEHIVELGFAYCAPLVAGSAATCCFLTTAGLLQGEGRTLLSGMVNLASLILNILILDPLFLFGLKTGMIGAGIATVISEVVPALTFSVLYYCKLFGIKPALRQLCQPFSPKTFAALRVGASQLVANVAAYVPSVVVRKLIGNATGDDFDNAMAGFNSAIRFNQVSLAFFNAVTMGFIPPASYAYAAKRYRRYLWLCVHSVWLCIVWGSITTVITWSLSREISKLFSTSEGYLDQAERMVSFANAAAPLTGLKYNAQSMLQSMQLGGRATLLSFLNHFLLLLGYSFLLYYTDRNDGARIVWCYPASYLTAILFSAAFLWTPLKEVWRLKNEQPSESGSYEDDDIHEKVLRHEEDRLAEI